MITKQLSEYHTLCQELDGLIQQNHRESTLALQAATYLLILCSISSSSTKPRVENDSETVKALQLKVKRLTGQVQNLGNDKKTMEQKFSVERAVLESKIELNKQTIKHLKNSKSATTPQKNVKSNFSTTPFLKKVSAPKLGINGVQQNQPRKKSFFDDEPEEDSFSFSFKKIDDERTRNPATGENLKGSEKPTAVNGTKRIKLSGNRNTFFDFGSDNEIELSPVLKKFQSQAVTRHSEGASPIKRENVGLKAQIFKRH